MRSAVVGVVVAAVVAVVIAIVLINHKSGPVLTPADVEKVTGLTNVREVKTDSPNGSKADLEFADQRGQTILRVNLISSDAYRQAKEQNEIEANGRKFPAVLFNAPVPGVGDDAFDGPKGPMPSLVYVRKGNRAALLTAVQAARLRLSPEDLHALAKIAADRL
jgi:hypothetical protein